MAPFANSAFGATQSEAVIQGTLAAHSPTHSPLSMVVQVPLTGSRRLTVPWYLRSVASLQRAQMVLRAGPRQRST